jgi:hypothetical protein
LISRQLHIAPKVNQNVINNVRKKRLATIFKDRTWDDRKWKRGPIDRAELKFNVRNLNPCVYAAKVAQININQKAAFD